MNEDTMFPARAGIDTSRRATSTRRSLCFPRGRELNHGKAVHRETGSMFPVRARIVLLESVKFAIFDTCLRFPPMRELKFII